MEGLLSTGPTASSFLLKVIVLTLGVVLPVKVDESKFYVLPHLLSAGSP